MEVLSIILTLMLALCSVLMVGLILLQRGRGGGLAGAFGGGGGETAFGTKSVSMAQKITILLAILLFLLTIGSGYVRHLNRSAAGSDAPASAPDAGR